jgi:pimeloyl-ACP methyl ester carboxylesterase/predicted enzyme related to lactoylglutathione lyase
MNMPQVDGVRHRDVVVRGLRLHVAEAGAGDAVVLQHGWPQHWWEWRHLIPALANRYHVICPDLRGFGWSEAPADDDYLKETLVDDVLALLAELSVERVRFVGHDWGAFIGFLICMRPEHPVERLVAMSALPPWPPPGGPDLKRLARLGYQLPIAAPTPGPFKTWVAEQALRAGRWRGEWSPGEVETYLGPMRLPQGQRTTTLMYRTFLLREAAGIARGKYSRTPVSVPVRFLIGERDLFTEPGLEEHVRVNAGDVEFEVVSDSVHFLPEDRPDLVRDRVLERPSARVPRARVACRVVSRPPFEQLDFVYMPSRDVAHDLAFYRDVVGAEIVFAIEAFGARVAQVRVAEQGPGLLLADHLEGDAPVLVYRVADLDATIAELEGRGLETEARFGIPHGPCAAFRAPGGQRLAVYELTRPEADAHLAGRHDFGPDVEWSRGSHDPHA